MGLPLRVLIVEDCADDAALLVRHLTRGGFDPIWERVDTAAALGSALSSGEWELVISDFSMPQLNGLGALRLVKERRPDLPFIQVSGTVGEDVAVEVMKAGAHDYLIKGNYTRLVPAIQRELREAQMRRERALAEASNRKSEERFRLLVEGVRDYAIYMLDPDGRIASWNSGAQRITGYTAAEVLGCYHALFYQEDDIGRGEPADHLSRARESGRFEGQGWRRRKDGSLYFASIVVTALRDEAGALQGFAKVTQDITERRRADERLRLSESLLAEAQQTAHIGSWNWHLADDTLLWSEEHYRILGLSPNAIPATYDAFMERTHPDDRAIIRDAVDRSIKDAEPYECVVRIVHEDGAVRVAHSRGQTVCDRDGRPVRMFGTLQDITQRARAEEALRTSDERFRAIARATNDAIWDWNLATDSVWWSDSFQSLFGYGLEEIEPGPESWYSRLHPDDFDRVSKAIRTAIDGGAKHWSDEYRFRRFDGSYAHVLDRGCVIYDENKRPIRMIGAMMDITTRKQHVRAIVESEARKAAILESGLDCIITMAHRGTITEFNPAAERTFGYKREEVIGRDLADLIIPAALREQHRQGLRRYEETGEAPVLGKRIEITAMRADGSEFPAEMAITQICIDGPPEFSAYLRDITERKQGEEAIWRARADLASRVEQRTSELAKANEALHLEIAERKRAETDSQRAKAVAEAASRSKSDFLAKMSHEIRTPLNGVIGMADLLLGTDLADRQRRYGEIIRSSGESLLSLINDILDFSKIEAGKLEISSADFDLRACAEEVVEMLAQRASAKGVEIACHVRADVPDRVRGDADRLRQILINLVGNAIKFTERGSVVVRVTAEELADDAMTLRVSVSDTGIGIAGEDLDRLFKSFSQVDVSATRRHGGTGLGLAISKQLAELMGGTVGVASELGRGSTFWFTAKLQWPATPIAAPTWPFDPAAVRVLAVDDSAIQREILAHQLNAWGFDQATADGGDTALAMLSESTATGRPFGLAILDADMPGGTDGVDLAKMIRSRAEHEGLSMILLTPIAGELDATTLQAAGFAGQIAKPLRQSQLFDAIMNVLAAEVRSLAIQPSKRSSPDAEPTRRLRVLLAEDNRVNQLVAVEILARAGHECDVVDNGNSAVEAVSRMKYDIVLMDCQMPVMDGFEATWAIRRAEAATPGCTPVPIVALTANAINGDRERCLAGGMNGYLSKPIDSKRLLEALQIAAATTEPLKAPRTSSGLGNPPANADAAIVGEPAPPFDTAVLLERCIGNLGVAETILLEFEKQAIGDVRHIEMLVEAGDATRVAEVAHALKGAAGILSADVLREVASDLEQMARAADWAGVRGRFSVLKAEADRCVRHVPTSRRALVENSKRLP